MVGALGGCVTVNSPALVAVPPGVVTVILPVVAPVGTAVLICVPDTTVKVAAVPLNRTALAPPKFVPVIVTAVPTWPLVGANDAIVGAGGVTVKSVVLVALPTALLTVIGPVVAPAGTVASMRVLDTMLKVAAVPPNWTLSALSKLVPVMVTGVPTGPLVGAKEAIVGGPPVGPRSMWLCR